MANGTSQRGAGRGRLALRLAAALILVWLMLRWFEHSQVYHPTRTLEATPDVLGRPYEEAQFRASDGVALHGWFFPAEAGSERARFAFLICHGNGGNISHRLELCDALLRTGASVFVFDYRGYGRSGGRPSEEGTYQDAQAAHDWLRQRGYEGGCILPYGESLGGAVAAELALRERVGGIVLQGTFTSIAEVGAELFPWLPVRWINTIRYDTRQKLGRVSVPVLVLHSREDELVAFHHGERNFAAARGPKLFRELRGGHNSPVWEQAAFGAAIEEFLRLLEEGSAEPPR
ncbi:MAG: alpha/beta hydrolase [Verrucomicrobiales bacterium]|nr:alpha/beta hydrolase [Verrucomicrobiales bacterium]